MIRSLRPHEPLPVGTPRRYLNADGYVRLRWHIGTDEYVEEYEHRVVAGRPVGLDVHHLNGDKGDNDPANLLVLTREAHAALHAQTRPRRGRERNLQRALRRAEVERRWQLIAADYAAGHGLVEVGLLHGLHHSNVLRGLRARGCPIRTPREGRWATRD